MHIPTPSMLPISKQLAHLGWGTGSSLHIPAQQMQRGCTRERLLQLQLLPLLLLTLAVCAALNGSNCADSGQYMHACCRLAHREVEEVGLLWV